MDASFDLNYQLNPKVVVTVLAMLGGSENIEQEANKTASETVAETMWTFYVQASLGKVDYLPPILVQANLNPASIAVYATLMKFGQKPEQAGVEFLKRYQEFWGKDARISSARITPRTTTPFLKSPYSGSRGINSFFDHRYPLWYSCNVGLKVCASDPDDNITLYIDADKVRSGNVNNCTLSYSCYDGHDGFDYQLSAGVDVFASAGGKVINNDSCGVLIDHGNGYTTMYWHITRNVSLNQQVNAGDKVGTVALCGISSGAHLHFGVKLNGRVTDPYGWCSGSGITNDYNGLRNLDNKKGKNKIHV